MSEISATLLSKSEFEERTRMVAKRDSLKKVSSLLGVTPYKEEWENKKLRAYWRFHISDKEVGNPYEIYLGEFINDQLVFGFILPNG